MTKLLPDFLFTPRIAGLRTLRRGSLIACLMLGMAGCGSDKQDLEYQGKPLAEWQALSRSSNPAYRLEAVRVLGDMPAEPAAMDRVKDLALHDPDWQIRVVALDDCYMLLDTAEHRQVIDRLLEDQKTHPAAVEGVGFRRSLALLGDGAKAYIPALERLRDTATTEDRRRAMTNCLHEIDPKYPAYHRPVAE